MTAPESHQVFGRYRLVQEIARGGMGVVYRAQDEVIGRTVALKVMTGGDDEDLARFDREVKAAAALVHPNIVQVHDVGVHDGRHYYTMDFIEGPSLAGVIREMTKLPPRAALRVALDVAHALEAAHAKNIVHRDIKPANILLSGGPPSSRAASDSSLRLKGTGPTDAFRVHLADFGLAKETDASRKLTVTGSVLGTPTYMSPEQASGHAVDARTDIYSLAAVLYEMVSGRPPFKGDNVNVVLLKVIHDDPAPLPATLNPDIRTIIAKGMEKSPDRRYATAADFADDLERCLNGEAISARPPSFIYRLTKKAAQHKVAATAIAMAVLALIGLGAYFLGPAWVDVKGVKTERRFVWPPGRHTLRFEHAGYDPQEAEVTAVPWQTATWTPPLLVDHGFLEVVSDPPGADVALVVGGEPRSLGTADGRAVKVPRGTHQVVLRLPDHADLSDAVHVPGGATVRFARTLIHEVGRLSVSCEPEGISMTVGGRSVALPAERLELPTGRYELLFEKRNHFPRKGEAVVAKAESRPAPLDDRHDWRRAAGEAFAHASLQPIQMWRYSAGAQVMTAPALGDLDGDGLADVVAASSDGTLHAISGRMGELIWKVRPSAGTSAASLADIDADGVLDAAVCTIDGRLLVVSGRDAQPLLEVRAGPTRRRPAVADVDADGVFDFIVGGEDGGVARITARGQRIWRVAVGDPVETTAAIGDLDGDRILDAVLGTREGPLVALSGKDGSLLWKRIDTGAVRDNSAILVDLDGDAKLDVVMGTCASRMWGLSGRDGRTLWEAKTGNQVRSTAVTGDLNGDGTPDVVFGSNDTMVHAVSGRDGASLWTHRTEGMVWSSPASLDIDADGVMDFAIGSGDSHVRALSGRDGRALWAFKTSDRVVGPLASGDLDGDGSADVVTGSDDGYVYALAGRQGTEHWRMIIAGTLYGRPGTGDLDGDGIADIIGTAHDFAWHAVSGRSGALLWRRKGADFSWYPPTIADLNGDGKADALATFGSSGAHALSGADGSTIWKVKVDSGFYATAIADFDGDGESEIAVAFTNGRLRCFAGRDGSPKWEAELGPEPRIARAADLDGDQRPDVFVAGGGWLAGYSGKTGSQLWRVTATVPPSNAIDCGDVTSDGRTDFYVAGGPAVCLVSGADGKVVWRVGANVPNLAFAAPAAVDVNGDGLADAIAGTTGQRVYAISSKDGAVLWQVRTFGAVSSLAVVDDADQDGRRDVVAGLSSGEMWLISSASGTPLRMSRGGEHVYWGGTQVLAADGWTFTARAMKPVTPTLEQLAHAEAWTAVIRKSTDELRAATSPRLLHARGLARLRTRDVRGALKDLQDARRLGLDSPELRADLVEATLMAGARPDVSGIPPAAVMLLLSPGRLSKEQRAALAQASEGDEPAVLVLAGLHDDAIAKLPVTDPPRAVDFALRALAHREKGDAAAARRDLDVALKLNPWNRIYKTLAR